jgi:mRNA-degrading endonuclease RelE of RelBE toxin-antitoxin system
MTKLRWSPEVAEEMEAMPLSWAKKIYETAELIAFMPTIGRVRDELKGKRAFPSGCYFIIYDVIEDSQVVHILTAYHFCACHLPGIAVVPHLFDHRIACGVSDDSQSLLKQTGGSRSLLPAGFLP